MSDEYKDWIGRQEMMDALVTAYQANALTATLDRDDPPFADGDAIPPGWHQFYMREVVKLSDTARDGHPKRGDFLPPIALPRRMWAGTKSNFLKPIHIGERIRKTTTIEAVTPKTGKTGQLVFLKLRHEIEGEDGPATIEIQDVVYREASKPGEAPPAPPTAPEGAVWARSIHPTAVLLFRFSALTMNSHRIHYDRSYVTEIEKYPGLLVHGPLTQTLLMDLFRREMPDATMKSFTVRAVSPLFDIHDFKVEGRPGDDGASASLWAVNHEGALAMTAEAGF
jgi:3-methylfumaryl-CoA hydratase